MWWVTTQKNGASALGLQRVLGLKQYQSVWTWLHKLRSAMVRPGRDLLTGRVEVDETYLGGLEEGLRGRLVEKKALIVIVAQEDGKGIGRIRLRQIPDASAESLHAFVLDSIQPGSVVHIDGWSGYDGLSAKGYLQEVTILKGNKETASELLPRVHRIVGLLKRWLSADEGVRPTVRCKRSMAATEMRLTDCVVAFVFSEHRAVRDMSLAEACQDKLTAAYVRAQSGIMAQTHSTLMAPATPLPLGQGIERQLRHGEMLAIIGHQGEPFDQTHRGHGGVG